MSKIALSKFSKKFEFPKIFENSEFSKNLKVLQIQNVPNLHTLSAQSEMSENTEIACFFLSRWLLSIELQQILANMVQGGATGLPFLPGNTFSDVTVRTLV